VPRAAARLIVALGPMLGLFLPVLAGLTDQRSATRPLTFEERVRAQEVIERFGYGYQTGARLSFEQAVPRSVIENKVRRSISQSRALEERWGRPITERMLQAELERIATRTKFPDRLRRLFHLLGDDPRLIRETLVRESLADRLARAAYAADLASSGSVVDLDRAALSEGTRPRGRSWDEWWAENQELFNKDRDGLQAPPVAGVELLPLPSPAACLPDDSWMKGILDDVPDPRLHHSAVWTGREMIIWGGTSTGPGGRYDPLTDSWRVVSSEGAPAARRDHTAVWTGSSMVVLGGEGFTHATPEFGGRYDPATDTWLPMSMQGAPSPRTRHTTVWTGKEVIVWGGAPGGSIGGFGLADGARYDPATDAWMQLEYPDDPPSALHHNAVWTGREMIVWGGFIAYSEEGLRGAAYDPDRRTWRLLTAAGTPSTRGSPVMLWTGSQMIVWGGNNGSVPIGGGARYDPAADAWAPLSSENAPPASSNQSALWTGEGMLIAGEGANGAWVRRYDPVQDEWTTRPSFEFMPDPGHTAVWTGEEVILWGASVESAFYRVPGLRYNPMTGALKPVAFVADGQPVEGIPVWSGRDLIVVGGRSAMDVQSNGVVGRYDPMLDRWSSSASDGAPTARRATAVAWTGHEVLVGGNALYTGQPSRYDPILDQWRPLSPQGAPAWSDSTLAAWTGTEWLVLPSGPSGTPGGRYDPETDSWRSMSPFGPTLDLSPASVVWTGDEMIVWGAPDPTGSFPPGQLIGGRYAPATDSWRQLPRGIPGSYAGHRAVWAGDRMLILGGREFWSVQIYDPVADAWSYRAGLGLWLRLNFSAVWTGSKVVIWGGYRWAAPEPEGYTWDPATDVWTTISREGSPGLRNRPYGFWTGSVMLIYGGDGMRNGGAYVTEQSVDNDGDGLSECAGDCDDAQESVAPGAVQLCGDALNNDCLDPSWPVPADERDEDQDSWSECDGDCLDDDPSVHPEGLELPGNTVDEDCDGDTLCDPSSYREDPGRFMTCLSRACRALVSSHRLSARICGEIRSEAAAGGPR
jgi:hypothetical protein